MRHEIETFRDGMFLAPSRTYGETYMEPIIRKFKGLFESSSKLNDAINANGDAEEIKCGKVLWIKPKGKSLVERIILESENDVLSRIIPFSDCYTSDYYANMQNVKRVHFSILKYVLLFEDCIKIFESNKEDVSKIPNWSGSHGSAEEPGKNGQFAITKNNIKWHLENNLVDTLTWKQVYEITKDIS